MNNFFCETQLSERLSKTPEGFLVCHDVPVTVAGDMYYSPEQAGIDSEGSIRVAKKIEDIHSDETMRSFEGKPITMGHPKDKDGNNIFVTPENSRELTYGTMQNVRPGSGGMSNYLMADFVITDKDAIEKVESGEIRQVSLGYRYSPANIQDGFFEQTDIRGNHVALVPRGRAGPQCAIFDSKEEKSSMSLKDKLKDALSVFSRAVDEAVPDEPKAEEVAEEVALEAKTLAADESPMVQAMEDMAMMNLDSRMYTLETMVAELVSKFKGKVLGGSKMELEMSYDEDITPDVVVEENKELDTDTISRAEILAPGIEKSGDDIKRRALDECYKTADGKKIIDAILGGKSFDEADESLLFNASCALISEKRNALSKKSISFDSIQGTNKNYRSVEQINANAKAYYAKQQTGVF